jgi:hypothetical protein
VAQRRHRVDELVAPADDREFLHGRLGPASARSYRLKHIALSWNPTGTVFVGPAIITQEVTLSPADQSYEGTFTLDQYAADGTTRLAHIEGTVEATRITP